MVDRGQKEEMEEEEDSRCWRYDRESKKDRETHKEPYVDVQRGRGGKKENEREREREREGEREKEKDRERGVPTACERKLR